MRALTLIAALCGTLALGACQTTALDDTIQRTLPDICRGADAAYASFSIYAVSGQVSDRTTNRVNLAYGELQRVCSDPASQNTATVLVAAAQAYATITIALDEAGE